MFHSMIARTITLSSRGTYPDKRSLFAAEVALFDKIVAKETSVPEGQPY